MNVQEAYEIINSKKEELISISRIGETHTFTYPSIQFIVTNSGVSVKDRRG